MLGATVIAVVATGGGVPVTVVPLVTVVLDFGKSMSMLMTMDGLVVVGTVVVTTGKLMGPLVTVIPPVVKLLVTRVLTVSVTEMVAVAVAVAPVGTVAAVVALVTATATVVALVPPRMKTLGSVGCGGAVTGAVALEVVTRLVTGPEFAMPVGAGGGAVVIGSWLVEMATIATVVAFVAEGTLVTLPGRMLVLLVIEVPLPVNGNVVLPLTDIVAFPDKVVLPAPADV